MPGNILFKKVDKYRESKYLIRGIGVLVDTN